MVDQTHFLVTLPLTDERRDHLDDMPFQSLGLFMEAVRAIGTPVEESSLETVAHEPSPLVPVTIVSPTVGTTSVEMMSVGNGAPLVRRAAAAAQIAIRNAQIAELKERIKAAQTLLDKMDRAAHEIGGTATGHRLHSDIHTCAAVLSDDADICSTALQKSAECADRERLDWLQSRKTLGRGGYFTAYRLDDGWCLVNHAHAPIVCGFKDIRTAIDTAMGQKGKNT